MENELTSLDIERIILHKLARRGVGEVYICPWIL